MTEVSELIGAELDAAVAHLEGWSPIDDDLARSALLTSWCKDGECHQVLGYLDFSQDWALGGQIIERERMMVRPAADGGWLASMPPSIERMGYAEGPTPLIAAMRAFVQSKQ